MGLRSKKKRADLMIGDPHDSRGFYQLTQRYLSWHQTRQASVAALRSRENQLNHFMRWCELRGLHQPREITLLMLESYQRYLYLSRKSNGEPLSASTQCNRLAELKSFFRWLTRRHYLQSNPAADIEMPKRGEILPKDVLSQQEVEILLNHPNIERANGLRDRAMLEVFYSTGMRRAELAGLTLNSINHERGTVMIRQGKGKKDRLIPIGDRACQWVKAYQEKSRPTLVIQPNEVLFLAKDGEGFSLEGLSEHIRRLIVGSGVRKGGSCHLLRHTMATLMLENGADTRWIQSMLGHANISTTQIYTKVSIRALKEIHNATHPAENAEDEVGLLADIAERDGDTETPLSDTLL